MKQIKKSLFKVRQKMWGIGYGLNLVRTKITTAIFSSVYFVNQLFLAIHYET